MLFILAYLGFYVGGVPNFQRGLPHVTYIFDYLPIPGTTYEKLNCIKQEII
jgi:hypothetical protein